jgi:biopolymer transport protein ExbB
MRPWPREIFAALIVAATLVPASASAATGWWNGDWAYRKKIELDTTSNGLPLTAALVDVPVPIRLHTGNFPYFVDVQPNGADLRFIAADDTTPLTYHIEQFEPTAGLAVIWVRIPRIEPNARGQFVWLYYGNPEASAATDSAATYDVDQTLVLHLSERNGLPQDATAYGHDANESSATPGAPGLLDSGVELRSEQSIRFEQRPSLEVPADRGLTFSAWVQAKSSGSAGALFTQGGAESLAIGMDANGSPYVRTRSGDETSVVTATVALQPDRWQHLSVTWTNEAAIYLDGVEIARGALPKFRLQGAATIGATPTEPGFVGLVDEIAYARTLRSADWLKLTAIGTSSDTKLITYGADETEDTAGGFSEYFALFWSMLGVVSLDGWIIIAMIGVLGLISADVIITKSLLLRRIGKSDANFLGAFRERFDALTQAHAAAAPQSPPEASASVLNRLWEAVSGDIQDLAEQAAATGSRALSAEGLQMIRANLDGEIVEQTNKLNSRMIAMTLAVSGAPFLGLLGTVVGVMITFASIAQLGDVNVNTIAPGVSAALATTVAGLLVAIPSLFAYNYIATGVGRRVTAMELFADQLLSRLAATRIERAASMGDRHAA